MGPSLKDCIGPIYNTNRQYHTTLLNENTGIGLWNLEDWGHLEQNNYEICSSYI
jgi:hypothetical protein